MARLFLPFLLYYYGLLIVKVNANHVLNTTVCSTQLDDSLWELMNEKGTCEPYIGTAEQRHSPCDEYFTVSIDYVYIPNTRLEGDQQYLRDAIEEFGAALGLLSTECREPITRALCFHFYLPCGNNHSNSVPRFFCPHTCRYLTETLCPEKWDQVDDIIFNIHPEYEDDPGLQLPNCSDTDVLINFLDLSKDCCTNAGISGASSAGSSLHDMITATASVPNITAPTPIAIISGVAVIAIILFCVLPLIVMLGTFFIRKYILMKKEVQISNSNSSDDKLDFKRYQKQYTQRFGMKVRPSDNQRKQLLRVPSSYFADLSDHMIDKSNIKLLELIGQGEFGMVYHAILTEKNTMPAGVAVKTLKGTFNENDVIVMFEETLKMKEFDHFNVLPLIGVFFNENGAPCIVMPYMSEGSLLSYLKRERSQLCVAEDASVNEEVVNSITKQLLSMCLQVANGMEYLSKKKFIHRDLAARNCMMSTDGVIKVADFGLSEDVYMNKYFRLNAETDSKKSQIKLPIKWMALESIHDGLFSEMTDVWSYGVLCWEVFSLGKSPYPGLSPKDVVNLLDSGQRMNKPKNMACTDEIFSFITSCWNENPNCRKHFIDVVFTVNELIKPLANYMDFTSFFSQSKSEIVSKEHS